MWCAGQAPLSAQPAAAGGPTTLEDDALLAAGWEFDDQAVLPGSIGAGLAAVVAGPVWTGIGHWVNDDQTTWPILLGAQGIGLAALGIGLATAGTQDARAWQTTGDSLAVAGASTLLAAWTADIIGGFRGSSGALPANTSESYGIALEVYYAALLRTGLAETSVGIIRLPIVFRWFAVQPVVELGVDLDYRSFGGEAEARLPLGNRRSRLALYAAGNDQWSSSWDEGATMLESGVEAVLDVGDVVPHLAGLVWTSRLGGAVNWPRFGAADARFFDARGRTFAIPIETDLTFNASRVVNLGLGYRHRRDRTAGTLSARLGALHGRVEIVPRNRLGVALELEQGAALRATVGLRVELYQP